MICCFDTIITRPTPEGCFRLGAKQCDFVLKGMSVITVLTGKAFAKRLVAVWLVEALRSDGRD